MKTYFNEEKSENFKEKLNYLKNAVDPHYLLENLGIKIDHETPKEIRSSCAIHGGDNKTAFRFNKESRTWVCFTQKCHEIYGNDVIGLIKALLKTDFISAVDYLKNLVGDVGEVNYIESKRKREIDTFIKSYTSVSMKHVDVNEEYLNVAKCLRSSFFLNEGFKKETLDYFEIAGGWTDKHGIIRDIIPIRDINGKLMSYSLRDTRKNVEEDFKYIFTPGFDKDNCLYNLQNVKKYGTELPLIIVEGFKSVWRLYEYGIKNVVAVMGSSITEGQQALLLANALKGVVVFFDNDLAGVNGIIKACLDLVGKLDVKPVFIQETDENGKGLDPADLTKEQVYEYLETYF